MSRTRAFITDTETASLKGKVVDFAAVEIDSNLEIIGQVETLIDPQCPIAPAAQAVHGISAAMVADAPTAAEFLELYGSPFAVQPDDKLIIIGHNVQFDTRILELDGFLQKPYTSVCTLRMARNQWPTLKKDEENHKLGTLAIMFGLKTGPAHRAMGDVVTCLNLLRHLADVTQVSGFEELVELGTRPLSLETLITFGKHKDTPLGKLPMDYVRWMRNQPDMDPDLIAALAVRVK